MNSTSNPAAKGSVITLFATGAGQTSPPSVDGAIAVPPYAMPVLHVSVKIDGIAAPGEVAGVIQVNATVPPLAHSGNVPVVLSVGNTPS